MHRRLPWVTAAATPLASVTLAVATLAGATLAVAPDPQRSAPRLVVFITVDQMRADYIDRYGHQWTGGLRRIVDAGARFARAAYPYGGTVTCPGHATVSTGTYPSSHGMVGNEWLDAPSRRMVRCTHDPDATPVPFGGGIGREFHSPRNLRRPTFADELRRQVRQPPRVVSVALKPRSAIMLAGRGGPGTIAVWEEDAGTWASSSAYTKTPWPAVDAFVRAHPMTADYGAVWTRLLAAEAYSGADDAPGEASPVPWDRTFPHVLESPTGRPDGVFVTAWERSPWSDAYVAALALAVARAEKLGSRADATDVLAMSFPAVDLVGHEFGPSSHEVQDVLVRLDRQLAAVLEWLDTTVGRANYVLALASDHGVARLPEESLRLGLDAGRLSSTVIQEVVERTLVEELGPGPYPTAYANLNLYLHPDVARALGTRPAVVQAVKRALLATAGVGRVYGREEIARDNVAADPVLAAWRLSLVPDRTGDFIVVPKVNWLFRSTGTTHGSPHEYDQRVPLVLVGAGVRPGRYDTAASPADIAPTLASLVGIRMPRAEGRVLTEALIR